MAFPDDSFDLVVCTEVLEHIPNDRLADACSELARVTRDYLMVGVPFKQDVRVGRTTCTNCRMPNPPWGHVNVFDEQRLRSLFSKLKVEELSFVGTNVESTNSLSTVLMDVAGNPYGTYDQEEPCIACGTKLLPPLPRSLFQKVCTKTAFWTRRATQFARETRPYWIHLLFRKTGDYGQLGRRSRAHDFDPLLS